MLSFCLLIGAFVSMIFLLIVFGYGMAILISGESDLRPGKTVRGLKARLMGLAMVLSAPLAVAASMITATIFIDWKLQDGLNCGLMLVAGLYWVGWQFMRKKNYKKSETT